MAIRIRSVDGITVALCAAETTPKSGDVYLDDSAHHALTTKFGLDWYSEGLLADSLADPKLVSVMNSETKEELEAAMNEAEQWARSCAESDIENEKLREQLESWRQNNYALENRILELKEQLRTARREERIRCADLIKRIRSKGVKREDGNVGAPRCYECEDAIRALGDAESGRVKLEAFSIESIDAAEIMLAVNPSDAIAILLGELRKKDAEIAELKKDKARIDWLEQKIIDEDLDTNGLGFRGNVDLEMEKDKP